MSGSPSNRDGESRLVPRDAPGRSTRKARAFAAEIGRLHALDYTLEAIREALAGAGVSVSRSTVWREAARHRAPRPAKLGTVVRADPSGPRVVSGNQMSNAPTRSKGQR